MTKNEFIRQAAISMATTVNGTNGISDPEYWNNVVNNAVMLAEELESRGLL